MISSVTVGRNDGYKDKQRGILHFKSLLETFDEIIYIDWNSPTGSYLWEIQNDLPKTGKIKHYIIPPSVVKEIIPYEGAQLCNESLSRNIGIRRAKGDWIVSTNIDIIAPTRDELLGTIELLNKDTFYTISRRECPANLIQDDLHLLRQSLVNIEPRKFLAKVTPNDNWSLINCCGDFQLAHKDVWCAIEGFEESMIYACFVDTNVQKKATLNNFKLEALFEPPLFHMEHGSYYTKEDGSRVSDKGSYKGDNKAYNDVWNYVELFQKTTNVNWGLEGIDIECEIY